jgi:hypothetical protein
MASKLAGSGWATAVVHTDDDDVREQAQQRVAAMLGYSSAEEMKRAIEDVRRLPRAGGDELGSSDRSR